jgi:hypothetical protein
VLGQAEVEQLRARRCKHDVSGLEVPVDDATLVCRFKSVGDLDPEAEHLCERQRRTFDP